MLELNSVKQESNKYGLKMQLMKAGDVMEYIQVDESNIEQEHICCAFSDKKCVQGYQMKKQWLSEQTKKGHKFIKLNERGKVFIEYGPIEESWQPILGENYLVMGCFWVSGKFKKCGHGKKLFQMMIDDAKQQGREGILIVTGKKKMHFMSDGKWLKKQGFQVCDERGPFQLLVLKLSASSTNPRFSDSVQMELSGDNQGAVVYYSNRCPFTEYHIHTSLKETLAKKNIPLKVVKLETKEQAKNAPSPATIFSLYMDGEFITTDVSICMESKFDKYFEV